MPYFSSFPSLDARSAPESFSSTQSDDVWPIPTTSCSTVASVSAFDNTVDDDGLPCSPKTPKLSKTSKKEFAPLSCPACAAEYSCVMHHPLALLDELPRRTVAPEREESFQAALTLIERINKKMPAIVNRTSHYTQEHTASKYPSLQIRSLFKPLYSEKAVDDSPPIPTAALYDLEEKPTGFCSELLCQKQREKREYWLLRAPMLYPSLPLRNAAFRPSNMTRFDQNYQRKNNSFAALAMPEMLSSVTKKGSLIALSGDRRVHGENEPQAKGIDQTKQNGVALEVLDQARVPAQQRALDILRETCAEESTRACRDVRIDRKNVFFQTTTQRHCVISISFGVLCTLTGLCFIGDGVYTKWFWGAKRASVASPVRAYGFFVWGMMFVIAGLGLFWAAWIISRRTIRKKKATENLENANQSSSEKTVTTSDQSCITPDIYSCQSNTTLTNTSRIPKPKRIGHWLSHCWRFKRTERQAPRASQNDQQLTVALASPIINTPLVTVAV